MKPLTTSPLRALTLALLLGTFISATIVPTVSAGPTSCVPVPAGLVGWWSGEGSALDSTGTNNGTLQGGASFLPGVVGQAFNFSPANGTVIVPDSTSLRLTSQLTIEAWINTRGTGSDYSIVAKNGGTGGDRG